MFLDCPAYLDAEGASRCALPAEVEYRYIQASTDGPLESAVIRCPSGHWFNGPIEFLTWAKTRAARLGTGHAVSRTRQADLTSGPPDVKDGRHDT
jgi:hypothetical protein